MSSVARQALDRTSTGSRSHRRSTGRRPRPGAVAPRSRPSPPQRDAPVGGSGLPPAAAALRHTLSRSSRGGARAGPALRRMFGRGARRGTVWSGPASGWGARSGSGRGRRVRPETGRGRWFWHGRAGARTWHGTDCCNLLRMQERVRHCARAHGMM